MKRVFFTVFLITFIFNVSIVLALDDGMIIKEMNINVDITEDNIYNVTEEITVEFLKDRHGIFRNIPLNKATLSINSITNPQEKKYEYVIESQGQDKIIKIGDEDYTVRGIVTYIIDYEISYKGKLSELSYNIVGPEWDTTIDKVNFTINMPKEFNSSEINIFSGKRGNESNELVSFFVDGNSIKGETTDQLSPKEGITIELPVGNDYFIPPKVFNIFTVISLIFVTLVPLLAIKSSKFYMKKRSIAQMNSTKVIGFYPPNNFNPIDLAYIAYPSKILSPEELTSILFYYANKGFIEIHNINGEYELRKCKHVTREDFQNDYEYKFFDHIFKLGDKKNGIIRATDFKREKLGFMESFISNSRIENLKKARYIENLIFNRNLLSYILTFPLAILGLFTYIYSISYNVEFASIFCIIIAIFSAIIILPISYLAKKVNFILNIVLGAGLMSCIMCFILTFEGIEDIIIGLIPIITIYIGICISMVVSQSLPSIYIHTKEGSKVFGETEGYKEFIKTAKIQELEMLIKENSSYYYDVLPYAICLKITNIFENKFKDLKYSGPAWYYGGYTNNVFLYSSFTNNYTKKLTDEYKAYVKEQQAKRSSSSSGRSVGGGSIGGGGGGSW